MADNNQSLAPMPNVAAPKRVPMINEYDEAITVDPSEVEKALAQGYQVENPIDEAARKWARDRGDIKGAGQVFIKNAINETLFGVPGVIEEHRADPLELAKAKALEKRHGVAGTLGSIAGFGASLPVGGPLWKGAAKGGSAVAKALGKVIAAESGGQIGARSAAQASKEILKRMAVSAAQYGTEGAIQMAPRAITEASLGDIDAAAESLMWGVGFGSLFGGAGALGGEVKQLGKRVLAGEGIETTRDLFKAAGKKTANVLTGTPEEALERYLQRGDAVKNAKPFEELKDDFLSKIDEAVETVSVGSGEGYKILEKSGKEFDRALITSPIDEAMAALKDRGKYSPEMRSAAQRLEDIANIVKKDSGAISAIETRRVMDQLREEGYLMKRQGLGKQGQIGDKMKEAAGKIDEVLKKNVDGYADHMKGQAANTVALKDISSKFRSEGGAQNLLKRVMRGKDDAAIKAIKAFDAQYQTNMYDDLLDSFSLQQLSKETTQGSRKTLLGTVIGGSFGGPLGGLIGAGAGAVADKYGTMLTRKAVDGILIAEKAMRRAAKQMDELPKIVSGLSKFTPKISKESAGLNAALRMFGEEPKANESREKAYERLSDKAYEYVQNPEKLSDAVAQMTMPISQTGAPQVASLMSTKIVGAHEYLMKSLPKELVPLNPFAKRQPFKPSKRDLLGFFQKIQVLDDPFSVLKELKNGTLTRNHMDALKTIYPRMHSLMQNKVRDQILSGVQPVPYDARLQLSLLMDEPYDTSLMPSAVQASQASYAEEEQQGEGGGGGAVEGDLAGSMKSDVESLST